MRLAIEISVIIVVFLIGYRSGFKACYDYLSEEVQKRCEDLRDGIPTNKKNK